MFVKVTKEFIDKYTREYHEVGKIIEVAEERAKEILSAGNYICEVKPEGKPDLLADMTVKELKAFAEDNGIDISKAKNKDEILATIREAQK